MQVTLLHHTPLWVASTAIRKCWASEDKSDTKVEEVCLDCGSTNINSIMDDMVSECDDCKSINTEVRIIAGPADKALIDRVGNKNKHASTLEHLNYNFDIVISRACLQELARHRISSFSVKSTRYTLKELRDASDDALADYLVPTGDPYIDAENIETLKTIRRYRQGSKSNDIIKYLLPEAYKTSLVWTVNARSLQNFLSLRSDKSALWEIRQLAHAIYDALPAEHKYLFQDFIKPEAEVCHTAAPKN